MIAFQRSTYLPTDRESAFDASLDVDLHLESFEDAGESIVGGVQSGSMGLGDDVTWRAKHFGIWWTMTSTITAFERPSMFVDEQRRGPFKRFHHTHTFEVSGEGTMMHDAVEFEAPLGPLGRIAERVALARYLPKLIDLRNAQLVSHFTQPSEDGDGGTSRR